MAKRDQNKIVHNLWDRAKEYIDRHEYENAIILLDKIDALAHNHSIDAVILMKVANARGAMFSKQSDYNAAEKYLLESLKLAKQIGNPAFISTRHDNLASIYTQSNQLKKAIEHLEKSRQLKEKNGNEKDLPVTLLNLISLYCETGDLEGTEKTLKETLYYIKKYDYIKVYQHYYYSKGKLMALKKNYPTAIKEYDKAIKYALQLNDFATAAKAYANQGNGYLDIQEWAKAKRKFTLAINMAQEHKLRGVELMAAIQIGVIAVEQGDLNRAREMYEYVNTNAVASDFETLFRDLEELKARLFEAEGSYKAALDAQKRYLEYYKKLYDKEMMSSIQNIQAKYEAEKKDRALEKAKLLQAQSELKALRAQMDPHFIFNALSSMRKELLEGNVDGADAYLVRFSKLLRLILDTTRTPEVRLSDNIELLHLYIQIEKNRQGNRFDYSIDTRGVDPDSVYIPGLILQPLAENAIVHGLYHKKNGQGKLRISFSKTKDALVIRVRDNGIGRLASSGKTKPGHISHAMSIIRETLDLTWQGRNVKNYFTIRDLMTKDNVNIGTEVTVLLPLS